MKKIALAGAALAATLGASLSAGALPTQPTTHPPGKKRKTKAKKRKFPLPNYYSRSKYIPAGEYRNCGDRGISPKLVERLHGR